MNPPSRTAAIIFYIIIINFYLYLCRMSYSLILWISGTTLHGPCIHLPSNIYIICELYTCWGSVYKNHNNKQLALVMLCTKWRTNPWPKNPWRTNSSPKNPRVTNKIPWPMAHGIHSLRNIEISEKKKRV